MSAAGGQDEIREERPFSSVATWRKSQTHCRQFWWYIAKTNVVILRRVACEQLFSAINAA
jgi:hypothetical protein